ncbi:MAG: DUF3798 domain-containing protein [Spirochaetes bacterium]|nr:DUF3798 domain-containing protein [Spirochaetota bacterium]
MKKSFLPFAAAVAALLLAMTSCGAGEPPAPVAQVDWRIGIITGTVSQNEEEYLAALMMQERFGEDHIVRITFPDNFGAEMEVTVSNVLSLADSGARAIVFVQAVPAAIAAMRTVRDLFGEDIFFFLGVTHEPPDEVAQHADIAMLTDDIALGRVIIEQAYRMGATSFAHISFPRHLGMVNIAARRAGLMETAAEFGMEWIELTAPDPMTEGVAQAQMFILDNMPLWIEEFGQNTAFFNTNCGMQEPMIVQIAALGGLYPLQCCPSPFHALPTAFNIDMDGREGDLGFVISQLQNAIDAAGGSGRFSTWPVPVNMLLVEVGVLYAIEYLEGRASRHDPEVLRQIVNEVAERKGGSVNLSNWPAAGGGYLENFYTVLADFINF